MAAAILKKKVNKKNLKLASMGHLSASFGHLICPSFDKLLLSFAFMKFHISMEFHISMKFHSF